jgi:hypothetical protein
MNRIATRSAIALTAALLAGAALVTPALGDLSPGPAPQAADKGKPPDTKASPSKDKAAAAQNPNPADKAANAQDKAANAQDKGANAADKNANPNAAEKGANAADKGDNAADKGKEAREGEPGDKAKADEPSSAADPAKRREELTARQKIERAVLAAKLKDKLKGQPAPAALKQELERHARRVARLTRIKSIAKAENDDDSVTRADKLLAKENDRHDKWIAKFDPKGGTP